MAAAAPAPQVLEQPIILQPQAAMKKDVEYKLFYQPIYVAEGDPTLYVGGAPVESLPGTENSWKKFSDSVKEGSHKAIESMTNTFNKIDQASQPFREKVSKDFETLGNNIQTGTKKMVDSVTTTFNKMKGEKKEGEENKAEEKKPEEKKPEEKKQ